MTKLHYFDQDSADPGDEVLQQAIAAKLVPPTCLLGGIVLAPILKLDHKPCDTCYGPRKRCKGTERLTDAELESEQSRRQLDTMFKGEAGDSLIDILQRKR